MTEKSAVTPDHSKFDDAKEDTSKPPKADSGSRHDPVALMQEGSSKGWFASALDAAKSVAGEALHQVELFGEGVVIGGLTSPVNAAEQLIEQGAKALGKDVQLPRMHLFSNEAGVESSVAGKAGELAGMIGDFALPAAAAGAVARGTVAALRSTGAAAEAGASVAAAEAGASVAAKASTLATYAKAGAGAAAYQAIFTPTAKDNEGSSSFFLDRAKNGVLGLVSAPLGGVAGKFFGAAAGKAFSAAASESAGASFASTAMGKAVSIGTGALTGGAVGVGVTELGSHLEGRGSASWQELGQGALMGAGSGALGGLLGTSIQKAGTGRPASDGTVERSKTMESELPPRAVGEEGGKAKIDKELVEKELVGSIKDGKPLDIHIAKADAPEMMEILKKQSNFFTLKKPDLKPGDAGYKTYDAPTLQELLTKAGDGETPTKSAVGAARIASDQGRMTASDTTVQLPDGTIKKLTGEFSHGTLYDGTTKTFRSADPNADQIWIGQEKIPNGSKLIAGEVTGGQGFSAMDDRIPIRPRSSRDPDGKPELDTYPMKAGHTKDQTSRAFLDSYRETEPGSGKWEQVGVSMEHAVIPKGVKIFTYDRQGKPMAKADGDLGDLFRGDGYGNNKDSVKKNWWDWSGDPKAYEHLMDQFSRENIDGTFDSQVARLRASREGDASAPSTRLADQPTYKRVQNEFPNASGEHLRYARALAVQAKEARYSSPTDYALRTITDQADIKEFVHHYSQSNTGMALHDFRIAIEAGHVSEAAREEWLHSIDLYSRPLVR